MSHPSKLPFGGAESRALKYQSRSTPQQHFVPIGLGLCCPLANNFWVGWLVSQAAKTSPPTSRPRRNSTRKRHQQIPSPCLPVLRRPASCTFYDILPKHVGFDMVGLSHFATICWNRRCDEKLFNISTKATLGLTLLLSQSRPRLCRTRSCRKAPQASRWSWYGRWSAPPPHQLGQGSTCPLEDSSRRRYPANFRTSSKLTMLQ